jgi:hypothetical protein
MPANYKEVIRRIQIVARGLSSSSLREAPSVPDPSARPNECFSNAERRALQAGGAQQVGWMFRYCDVAALPGPGYLLVIHHAVWRAPDGSLIDVTPHPDPKYQPITTASGAVLFLPDDRAEPRRKGKDGVGFPRPSWYFPLSEEDAAMAAYVANRNAEELAEWKRLAAQTEWLKGSLWPNGVLRSRHKALRKLLPTGRK